MENVSTQPAAGGRIAIEENASRVKIIIPLQRLWPYWLTYTALLVVWLFGSGWAIRTLVQTVSSGQVGFEGLYLLAWILILLIITAFWIYMGRMIWKRWQYYTANREILFFYPDKLIVRRPLSLLGVTDAYDRSYMGPLRYDTKLSSAVFDYGSFRIPVGITLPRPEAEALIELINGRFFPDSDFVYDDE